ncbi:MAG: family 16 glycosylhydrolase [Muribaculaceae bacterium]|nr:family 16 glycosylhydrolase [Muribaculaceae bacterium]
MKLLKLTIFAIAALAVSESYGAPTTGSGETNGYKLVWQDLFDGTELNRSRWNIEVNGDGGGNDELQYYTDRNVRVGKDDQGNGCLILTAKRENYMGKNFTSGRVNSKKLISFKHGKVEASIKLPKTANGLWPAFWMMGNDIDEVGWPRCGEIDIMEFGHCDAFGAGTQDRYFNGACHWGQGWPQPNYARAHTHDYSLQDGEFHLYTCIWDENSIAMYCDLDKYPNQEPYYIMGITDNQPGVADYPGNYFHKENFILFNLAVGGQFPQIFNANGVTALNSGNNQEQSMYIDFVKVYQKGGSDESHTFADAGDPIGGTTPEPIVPKPTTMTAAPEPTTDASLVKSFYSDTYASVVPDLFVGWWGQTTETEKVSLEGNEAMRMTNFNYMGLQFSHSDDLVDLSDMKYLHIDLYSTRDMEIEIYPISLFPTYDLDKSVKQLSADKWCSFDMPLSEFPNVNFAKLGQFKFVNATASRAAGDEHAIYIDNLYAHKGSLTGVEAANVAEDCGEGAVYDIFGREVRRGTDLQGLGAGIYIVKTEKSVRKVLVK